MKLELSLDRNAFEMNEVIEIYKANQWSSAEKPELLLKALRNSDSVVTVRDSGKLIGIGNALSDGYLVVYYPHLLVHPDYQGKGVGRAMMERMQQKYKEYHQQMVVADGRAVNFYKSIGFVRAGQTESMWIYGGIEH
jgi:GNAT superfamily N-acetyltransferase